ncbi:protein S40-5-like [Humulus lupulus]|uniref:protein S40-5-like n=1 Tax=Humulus lupulus TaxID=3486 RepID=UPI002B401D60|nr:protein S40-5-like [Humulus lupulus]
MAKGRKLTTSRSERLLGSNAYSYGHSQGSSGTDSSELGEDDVWSMVGTSTDMVDHSASHSNGEWNSTEAVSTTAEGMANMSIRGRRRIHPDEQPVGGLSLAFDSSKTTSTRILHQFRGNDGLSSSPRGHQLATSLPVNVPDWSKILRVDSVDSLHELDDGMEDCESEMVPPHEYLAREYAYSRKPAATSVFEGVGRTLKGRDMSRVRDAVWRQTGFDG